MPRPLQYSYRGDAREASEDFSSTLERVGTVRAWAHIVGREGAAVAWLVVLASYLAAFLVLLPMDGFGWLGLIAIHLVYGPLVWLFYRWTHDLPVFNLGRVRRAERWLSRLSQMAPVGTALDVEATLGRTGCQGRGGRCGTPWLYGYVFLPDGHTLEMRVTDGRACPAVRQQVQPGSTLLTFLLDGPSCLPDLARMRDCLIALGCPDGYRTREVELDGLSRLVWTLEQDAGVSDELPMWPASRLRSLIAGLDEGGFELDEVRASASASLEAPRQIASSGRTSFPLRRRSTPLMELLEEEKGRLAEAIPHPSVMLVSVMMGINALLGGGLLSLAALLRRPSEVDYRATSALATGELADVWAFAFVAAVLLAGIMVAPTTARFVKQYRRRRRPAAAEVGHVDLKEACLLVDTPDILGDAARIDLTRPFSVDLTRERGMGPRRGRVRVHLTLRQRRPMRRGRPDEVVVVGISSEVDRSARVDTLPALGADYPEMSPGDFRALWAAVREAGAAQGHLLPNLCPAGRLWQPPAGASQDVVVEVEQVEAA